jgi:putative Mg2+ transporter-C (MgtC) family protein
MALTLGWPEIALWLALTLLAGALIGLDRGVHGRPAGLRTTLLVCLAASLAMLLANSLINTVGKAPISFINLDLMRLPLGILTGVGFIGGGAILRRGDRVLGVTTAATLWFATVIGLCLGGGELGLGMAGTGLGLVILTLLRGVERLLPRDHQAALIVVARPGAPSQEVDWALADSGMRVTRRSIAVSAGPRKVRLELSLQWRCRASALHPPAAIAELGQRPGVLAVSWRMRDPER